MSHSLSAKPVESDRTQVCCLHVLSLPGARCARTPTEKDRRGGSGLGLGTAGALIKTAHLLQANACL